MSKKLLCLAMALLLALCGTAFAEDEPQPATGKEMADLLSSVLETAVSARPVNDPAADEARSEDGTRFQFENVSLYASGTEITPETPVNVIQFSDSEGDVSAPPGSIPSGSTCSPPTRWITRNCTAPGNRRFFTCGKPKTAGSPSAASCGTGSGSTPRSMAR